MPKHVLSIEIEANSAQDLVVVQQNIEKGMKRLAFRGIRLTQSRIHERVEPPTIDMVVDPIDRLFRGSGGL